MSDQETVSGGCACGAIRYEFVGEPAAAINCHCRDCQRASGAGFASAGGTIAATGTAAITITADGDNADAFSIEDQLIGNAAGTGTITLTGDEFTVVTPAGDTTVIDGAGALIIQPQTAATTIEIGDETGAAQNGQITIGQFNIFQGNIGRRRRHRFRQRRRHQRWLRL